MALHERRVVVVLDPFTSGSTVAAQGVDLAVLLGGELSGVFVEDVELVRAARLPFSRLFHDTGASQGLDVATVETTLRAAVSRARNDLEEAARLAQLAFSFRVARGTLLAALAQDSAVRDLIVVGSAVRSAPASVRPDSVRPSQRPAPVAVVLGESGAEGQLLDVVEAMTRSPRGAVRLIVPRASEPRLLARVERWTGRLRDRASVDQVAELDATTLAPRIAKARPRALIVALDDPWLSDSALRVLRRRLACPIILVR